MYNFTEELYNNVQLLRTYRCTRIYVHIERMSTQYFSLFILKFAYRHNCGVTAPKYLSKIIGIGST